MLSFQKENELVESAKQSQQTNTPKTAPQGIPAVSDDSSQYYTITDKKQQVKRSTYLLIALFIVGVFCLWFMIKKSTPSSVLASTSAQKKEQGQIEAAIARITGVRSQMSTGLEKIVKKFYEFSDFEQINVNELSKNPFRIDNVMAKVKPAADPGQFIVRSELELLTIMSTEQGRCCMINDKILYKGDFIQGLEVMEITDKDVSLSNGETSITLKLTDAF